MKTLHAFACALALLAAAHGNAVAQKVGTSSFQFLKVMPTARATALGDAYATLAKGVDGVFWNPAGLTAAQSHQLTTTLTLWLFDTKQSAIAYALPLEDIGTFGVQLQFVDYGEIRETRADELRFTGSGSDLRYNPGYTGNVFSPSAYIIGVSYARQLTEQFSAGITAKFISESLWDRATAVIENEYGETETVNTAAREVFFDFGMRYATGFRSVEIGISVQNLGPQVKFAQEGYPAPLAFRVGAAANLLGPSALALIDEHNRLTVAWDIFQPNDYAQQMHLGLEYSFHEILALRTGYKFNYDNDGMTYGGGVASEFAGFAVAVDYSFGDMGDYLGNVHRISLGVNIP
jgi:hypothetical protein